MDKNNIERDNDYVIIKLASLRVSRPFWKQLSACSSPHFEVKARVVPRAMKRSENIFTRWTTEEGMVDSMLANFQLFGSGCGWQTVERGCSNLVYLYRKIVRGYYCGVAAWWQKLTRWAVSLRSS